MCHCQQHSYEVTQLEFELDAEENKEPIRLYT